MLTDLEIILCVYGANKNLSKCFNMTLLNYKAVLLDGLSKHYGYRSQEPRRVMHTVLQHDINSNINITAVFIRTPK